MQFVLPFLKSRIQTGTLPPSSPGEDNEDLADIEDDSVKHEGDTCCETSREGLETPMTTENDPSKKSGEESRNPDLVLEKYFTGHGRLQCFTEKTRLE